MSWSLRDGCAGFRLARRSQLQSPKSLTTAIEVASACLDFGRQHPIAVTRHPDVRIRPSRVGPKLLR